MLTAAVRSFFHSHGIGASPILLAFSGGVDSTALLCTLVRFREESFEIIAGHVNHHLRGEDADEDEAFARRLCERVGVPFHVVDGTLDPDLVKRHGIEAAARVVRERALHEIRNATSARFIATAHQRNDQAETILMRILSGTGVAGLRGIHPVRDDGFIRPLLDVTREEIEAFLVASGETARQDRMNTDTRYLRTGLRHILGELGTTWVTRIAALADDARSLWTVIERAIDAVEDVDMTADRSLFRTLPAEPFLRRALLHRHIRRLDPQTREISSADLDRLVSQIGTGRRISVTRNLELLGGESIVLRRRSSGEGAYEIALLAGCRVDLPDGRFLAVARGNGTRENDVRCQAFQLPPGAPPEFIVRNRRPGDRLRPLGLGGHKKVKDLLIDRKIPLEERDAIPLLVWRDQIVWVAGVALADAFRLREEAGDRYVVTIVNNRREA